MLKTLNIMAFVIALGLFSGCNKKPEKIVEIDPAVQRELDEFSRRLDEENSRLGIGHKAPNSIAAESDTLSPSPALTSSDVTDESEAKVVDLDSQETMEKLENASLISESTEVPDFEITDRDNISRLIDESLQGNLASTPGKIEFSDDEDATSDESVNGEIAEPTPANSDSRQIAFEQPTADTASPSANRTAGQVRMPPSNERTISTTTNERVNATESSIGNYESLTTEKPPIDVSRVGVPIKLPTFNQTSEQANQQKVDNEAQESRMRLTKNSSPEEVCRAFLNALERSDHLAANQILTNIAQLQTARADLVLESPGAGGSRFEILPARFATSAKEIAQVPCSLYQPGQDLPVKLTWMMRKQFNGWKISGMSVQVSENGQVDLLSFENPKDLQRIQSNVSE